MRLDEKGGRQGREGGGGIKRKEEWGQGGMGENKLNQTESVGVERLRKKESKNKHVFFSSCKGF